MRTLSLAALALLAITATTTAAAQQPGPTPRRPTSTPPSGDTTGYWQQQADYNLTVFVDEQREVIRAGGYLRYINNSPNALTELYVHQHLNAFRPGSKWSEVDIREKRTRFQSLDEPKFAYERFTQAPSIVRGSSPTSVGTFESVRVEYPGAPDSSVARLVLTRPIRPGDTVLVRLDWEARVSTTPRRNGRRGRHYDYAQWYPKVAVYDRGGWQTNPLVPAGEFYGEFGDFTVTFVLPQDQVIGATGVPVNGDPGWARVSRSGAPVLQSSVYRRTDSWAPGSILDIGGSDKRSVTFHARNVHHFAWSIDPQYIYEGGAYVRPAGAPRMRFPTYDTVAVHVLYRPGDDSSWGRGIAVQRTIDALKWLEDFYGPYGYPQVTNLHRLDGGGTEFPMMMHNGSAQYGLILHEFGHIYTYGILANNEWRSGWLDEGLTSFQESWGTNTAPPEIVARELARDPRWLARDPSARQLTVLDSIGRLGQPMGTHSSEFRDFGLYNYMAYSRAEDMYHALRDIMGDTLTRRMWRDYYARWGFRHVDRWALQRTAERVGGRPLGWFFDQWVDRTGGVRYRLTDVQVTQRGTEWVTTARLSRLGEYRHPMPVGVRTAAGWTVVRGDPARDSQQLTIRTTAAPELVRLDPFRLTDDYRAFEQRWSPPATP
jgi:hypothetical protein